MKNKTKYWISVIYISDKTYSHDIGSLCCIQIFQNYDLGMKLHVVINLYVFIPLLPEGGGRYTVLPLSVCPSFLPSFLPRPSKIFFVTFFSVTVDGRNLIFGHKRHIGIPYCG